jgi:hypothetical protein
MASIFEGVGGTALNILGAARSFYKGIGLSRSAHELTSAYLNKSASSLNAILSLGVAVNSSTDFLQLKIKAIRASLPQSQISQDVLDAVAKAAEEDAADNGKVAASANGTNVDTTA